jgi:hypothetical protein
MKTYNQPNHLPLNLQKVIEGRQKTGSQIMGQVVGDQDGDFNYKNSFFSINNFNS